MLRHYAEKYLLTECEPTCRQYVVEAMRRLTRTAWDNDHAAFDEADRAVILVVLRAAVVCCEYGLFNDVFGLVNSTVARDIFDLVKVSALAGRLDVSNIKERFVRSIASPIVPIMLTVRSMLYHILQGDLEHRGTCLQLLRPSKTQRNDDLERLIAEVAGQSAKDLNNISRKGLLRESDGAGIMNMVNSRQGYNLFKTRYGQICLQPPSFLRSILTLPFAVFFQSSRPLPPPDQRSFWARYQC